MTAMDSASATMPKPLTRAGSGAPSISAGDRVCLSEHADVVTMGRLEALLGRRQFATVLLNLSAHVHHASAGQAVRVCAEQPVPHLGLIDEHERFVVTSEGHVPGGRLHAGVARDLECTRTTRVEHGLDRERTRALGLAFDDQRRRQSDACFSANCCIVDFVAPDQQRFAEFHCRLAVARRFQCRQSCQLCSHGRARLGRNARVCQMHPGRN